MLHKKLQFKHVKVLVTIMTALWLAFVIGGTVCRYLLNWSSTFDFGIFSQMYYYMKETFLPLTTCELFVFADLLAFSKSHYAVCHTGRGNRGRSGSLLPDCKGQGTFSPCCTVLLRNLLHVSGADRRGVLRFPRKCHAYAVYTLEPLFHAEKTISSDVSVFDFYGYGKGGRAGVCGLHWSFPLFS